MSSSSGSTGYSARSPKRPRDRRYPRPQRAVSSVGRAPALQAGGRWFEPGTAHFSGGRGSVDPRGFLCFGSGHEDEKMRLRLVTVVLTLSMLCVLTPISAAVDTGARSFRLKALVIRVRDGDTIQVRLVSGRRQPVRLIGIAAPDRGWCYSATAARRARSLALGRRVSLIGDPTQRVRDGYGRLLAYVMIGRRDLGRSLLAGGYAYLYAPGGTFARIRSYRARERPARRKRLGLWSACRPAIAAPESPSSPPTLPPPPPAPPAPPTTPPPEPPASPSPAPSPEPAPAPGPADCGDGIDNDSDGAIDYPADPGCSDSTDRSEFTDAPDCHPSYPTLCIPPPPPELNCDELLDRDFTVRHDVADPDPHRFDPDRNGIGCETGIVG
jgi:micrococcal nuclease